MRRVLALLVALAPLTASATPDPGAPSDPGGEPPAAALQTPPHLVGSGPEPYDPLAPPPGGWRLMLSDLTIFRLNPLGLETRARFGLQKRLYASESDVARTNFLFVGMFPKLNPVSVHAAIGAEIQPLSIFNLRVFAEASQWFGILGFMQSFTTATANYSDTTLKEMREDPGAQKATHLRFGIWPQVQLRLGPLAVRSLFQLDYWDISVRDGDVVAYEPTVDTLVPDRGWVLQVDTDVLYVDHPGLALGVRHTAVRPYYKERHFADRADFDAYGGGNGHDRIGLFGAYTFRDRGPSRFNKPTVIVILSWYTDHRWRTGVPLDLPSGTRVDDFVSRAFPYIVGGFAFESDFLAVR